MRKLLILGGLLAAIAAVVSVHWWTDPRRAVREEVAERNLRLREAPGRTGILAEEKRYSLFDEELIIRHFFDDRRGGFFVDVGCSQPIRANNTYYLEKHLDWRGIGIDALDEYAAAWSRERPNSRFFSFLVTDHSGKDGVFFKSEIEGLSSVNPKMADGGLFGLDLDLEEIRVPSITLDALLEQEGVEEVDLLALDIEGHELEALRGFDIERFRPALVVVEGKRPMVARYFADHGYELLEHYVPFDEVNRYYAPR